MKSTARSTFGFFNEYILELFDTTFKAFLKMSQILDTLSAPNNKINTKKTINSLKYLTQRAIYRMVTTPWIRYCDQIEKTTLHTLNIPISLQPIRKI